MSKVMYLVPKIDVVTGGVKVNEKIYNKILEIKGVNVDLYNDSWFLDGCKLNIYNLPVIIQSLIFNFIYYKNKRIFRKYDYLLVDSRLYPRLYIFILLAGRKKFKIITTHHHFCYLQQHNIVLKYIHKIVELGFLKKANHIIVFSRYTYFESKKNKLKQVELIELGFDNCYVGNYKTTEEKYLLFIGTVEPRKGIQFLIESMKYLKAKMNNIVLYIVGDNKICSKYYHSICQLVNKYGLNENVKILGRVGDTQLEKIKSKASIFVFSSLYEGFGMVMAECMSIGMPVVAFKNSAMPYIVENNVNGYLAKNKDSFDFSQKVLLLLENQNLRLQLSRGAIETARRFVSTETFLQNIKSKFELLFLECNNC